TTPAAPRRSPKFVLEGSIWRRADAKPYAGAEQYRTRNRTRAGRRCPSAGGIWVKDGPVAPHDYPVRPVRSQRARPAAAAPPLPLSRVAARSPGAPEGAAHLARGAGRYALAGEPPGTGAPEPARGPGGAAAGARSGSRAPPLAHPGHAPPRSHRSGGGSARV